MVELQFSFEDTAQAASDLFLKTVDDFIIWLEQQDDELLPYDAEMGIMVRSRYSPEGQLHREIEFQTQTGAALFLKLWDKVQQEHERP